VAWILLVMENGLKRQLNLIILANGPSGIKISIPLWEITARNFDADAVSSFEYVTGCPQTERVLVNFIRLDKLRLPYTVPVTSSFYS
jgi:hypothetical protein